MLDQRERWDDPEAMQRVALVGHQAGIWTALPGIIQSFDAEAMTLTVQPAVQGMVQGPDGVVSNVNLPLLVDVPVCFPRGGGYTLTFPIKSGDECLVVFASRCIDAWWQLGGVQKQLEQRLHDLSDGFAIVGPFSQQTKIAGVSTTTTQLRSNSGTLFVELDAPNNLARMVVGQTSVTCNGAGGIVDIKAPAQVTIDAPLLQVNGIVKSTGDMIAGTISVEHHVHGGVQTGLGNTAVPVP